MRHRPRRIGTVILALCAPLLPGAGLPHGEVSSTVSGLRSDKGQVLACLTARPEVFPNCEKDPSALIRVVAADETVTLDFGAVPEGRYAISLFHDENGNGKLDKRLLVPREGYGFSRNAPVILGPPSFRQAAFTVGPAGEHQTIRMRYMF